tara:strand:- start:826 stop:3051 length:2226 start_codon:yes stop_codon:yes gene_type:complete
MDRSKFPQGVEVQQDQLENVEAQVAFQILTRFVDSIRAGRLSGSNLLVVPSASAPGKVDVGAGNAYAANGELVEVGATSLAVEMADSTVGVVNLICAFYTEVDTNPQAHETDGTVKYTRVKRAAYVKCLTQAQYDALPASSTDVTVETAANCVILASVIPSQVYPLPILTTDITQQSDYLTAMTVDAVTSPLTVTGVQITALDQGTPTTVSGCHLKYDQGANELSWSTDGGVLFGVGVTPASGLLVLQNNGGTLSVTVDVEVSLLPVTTQTDIFTASDLYVDIGPLFSMRDDLLRSKKGSALQTDQNPHGVGLEDLAAAIYRLPQTLVLGENLLSNETEATVARIVSKQYTGAGLGVTQRTLLWDIPEDAASNTVAIRLYVGKGNEFILTFNAQWDNPTGLWTGNSAISTDATMCSLRLGSSAGANQTLRIYQQSNTAATWDDTVGAGGWSDLCFDFGPNQTGLADLTLDGKIIAIGADLRGAQTKTSAIRAYDTVQMDNGFLVTAGGGLITGLGNNLEIGSGALGVDAAPGAAGTITSASDITANTGDVIAGHNLQANLDVKCGPGRQFIWNGGPSPTFYKSIPASSFTAWGTDNGLSYAYIGAGAPAGSTVFWENGGGTAESCLVSIDLPHGATITEILCIGRCWQPVTDADSNAVAFRQPSAIGVLIAQTPEFLGNETRVFSAVTSTQAFSLDVTTHARQVIDNINYSYMVFMRSIPPILHTQWSRIRIAYTLPSIPA